MVDINASPFIKGQLLEVPKPQPELAIQQPVKDVFMEYQWVSLHSSSTSNPRHFQLSPCPLSLMFSLKASEEDC